MVDKTKQDTDPSLQSRVTGLLVLGVLACLLYLTWYFLQTISEYTAIAVTVFLGFCFFSSTIVASLGAGFLASQRLWLPAGILAHYDLSVASPIRRLILKHDPLTSTARIVLADQAIRQGRLQDAEEIVLTIDTSGISSILSSTKTSMLIQIYAWTGRSREALELVEQTVRTAESEVVDLSDIDPNSTGVFEEGLAETYSNLGSLLCTSLGKLDEGILLLNKALDIRTRLHGADSIPVAKALNNLGVPLHKVGKSELAEEYLRRAVQIQRSHKDSAYLEGYLLDSLAQVLVEVGKTQEALELSKRAVHVAVMDPNEKALRHFTFAKCLHKSGKRSEALAACNQALKQWSKIDSISHPELEECKQLRERIVAGA